jgi:parallel beta-helix repeat protein
MAANPDQVWVGARRQLQVASRAEVTDGRFFVDEAHRQLVLGTDPAGSTVRASTLSKALTIAGQGSVVRGIGIRRYATSVWQLGTVTVNAPDVDLRDLTVVDNATTGLSVTAADAQLDKITAQRNGMLGVHAHLADGLRVSRLLAAGNNVENFSRAPVAGGMKVTTSRDIQIQDSAFVGNRGHGLWLDESCYRASVTESTSASNTGSGVVVEVSSDVLVAGDTLSANAGSGLWVINTDQVEIANNTVSMNQQKGITLTTGDRSVQDRKAAVDSRRPDDPAMVWVSRDVTAYNNLIEGAGRCLVCVDDPRTRRVPAVTGVSFDHDVYVPHASAVGAIATWPGPESTVEYPSFAAFRAGTGQETDGRQIDATGTAPTARQPDVVRGLAVVARPLSPAVVEATGRSTDSQQIGAWSEAGNN